MAKAWRSGDSGYRYSQLATLSRNIDVLTPRGRKTGAARQIVGCTLTHTGGRERGRRERGRRELPKAVGIFFSIPTFLLLCL
jgi:hypothetical protein